MKFLGFLLIIVGISGVICSLFAWFLGLFLGLIFISLGCICISSANRRKREEIKECEREKQEEQKAIQLKKEKQQRDYKDNWIARRTAELMQKGMSPSDARVQADTEFVTGNKYGMDSPLQKVITTYKWEKYEINLCSLSVVTMDDFLALSRSDLGRAGINGEDADKMYDVITKMKPLYEKYKDRSEKAIYLCSGCGRLYSDTLRPETRMFCIKCGSVLIKENITAWEWDKLSAEEKDELKHKWREEVPGDVVEENKKIKRQKIAAKVSIFFIIALMIVAAIFALLN